LERAKRETLTYEEIGATDSDPLPANYHHVSAERLLGHGDSVFAAAVAGLREWMPQRGSGLSVVADGPVAVDTVVAMAAPLPVGFAIVTCRVVYLEEEPDRFAFAYGTLPLHPESGEERFEIVRADNGVVFRIAAFSRPQQVLSRIGAPVARRLQAQATSRYLDAMQRCTA
jgi:uncharacterized protein (UPF0548 family)